MNNESPDPVHPVARALAQRVAQSAYQALVQPDRPLEPDQGKNPWLAGAFSFVLVGAGQMYNRQLFKSLLLLLLFYLVGTMLFAGYAVACLFNGQWNWGWDSRLEHLAAALPLPFAGLWLYAILDAFFVARALRSGRLIVRFGLLRQTAFLVGRFLPWTSRIVPAETIRREQVAYMGQHDLTAAAHEQLLEWTPWHLARYSALGLAALLFIVGLVLDWLLVLIFGGLLTAAGILVFLLDLWPSVEERSRAVVAD